MFDSSPDCIKILELDGTIKRLNPGGKVALELDRQDQLDGADWPSLWPGSEQARVLQAIADGRAGKRTQFLAFCPTLRNAPRWWDVVVTPIRGTATSSGGLLAVSRDVTELMHARQALAQANDRKDDFLATLSHELRNPLSTLAMGAQLLEQMHGKAPEVARVGEMITRQVNHMSRLTEDLLDVSRITRGQVTLHSERFDMRDSMRDLAEQLKAALAAKHQTLHETVPDTPLMIDGDRMRLAQVLGNLVGNASRYSPPAAPIEVVLDAADGFARATVVDKGRGIAPDMIATLFDMYSQGHAATDRKASGVGMGLSIVKGLVELHGGTVQVQSAGAGMGSTFTVLIPLSGP